MDRKEEVAEEESFYSDEGEITLAGIAAFMRRAWVRIVIYLTAVAVLVTVVMAGYKFFGTAEYSVSLKIEMSFKEISEGKNPDKSSFSMGEMRSVGIVREAINDAGLKEAIESAGKELSDVRDRVSVEAVMPASYVTKYNELVNGGMTSEKALSTLSQMTFYPSQFVLSLSDYKAVGIDKEQAIKLVNQLADNYKNDFEKKYLTAPKLADETFSSLGGDNYDYLDYFDLYSAKYVEIGAYLSATADKAPDFVSKTGKTFTALKAKLGVYQNQLSSLRSFVVENGIFTNLASAKASVNARIKELEIEKTRLMELTIKLQQQLKDWAGNKTITYPQNGSVTENVNYPQEYNDLQVTLSEYFVELTNVQASITENENIREALKDLEQSEISEANSTAAATRLENLKKESDKFVEEIDALVEEYAGQRSGAESIKVVSPAAYNRVSPEFPTLFVYVGGLGFAFLLAIVVTWILGKKNEQRKEKTAYEKSDEAKQ